MHHSDIEQRDWYDTKSERVKKEQSGAVMCRRGTVRIEGDNEGPKEGGTGCAACISGVQERSTQFKDNLCLPTHSSDCGAENVAVSCGMA
jgi:hypothetical protein